MRLTSKAVAVILVTLLSLTIKLDAARALKAKKHKPIDWNSSYYSQPFGMCKKLRNFNPVEMMRAQAWAADVFRRCGAKLAIYYGTKINFPAYGIEKAMFITCLAVNFFYPIHSGDNAMIIDRDIKTSEIFALLEVMARVLKVSLKAFKLTYRGRTSLIPTDIFFDFLSSAINCVFDKGLLSQPDGDVVKHALVHAKIMLL